ncbi:MAG: Hpt domain-containing protein, partial [Mariprofundaceae bacterium]|nr:Hpt domain-containing protein [Mariprofundaceae bacterium]
MSDFDLSGFIASFFDEAKERLAAINQSLVAFESGTLDEEGLVSLRRDAHTIKGSALMLGVNDVGDVSHLFEDAMEYLIRHPEHRTPAMVQFLFDIHDQLQRRLEDQEGRELLQPEPLREQFRQLLNQLESGEVRPEAGKEAAAPADEQEEMILIEPDEGIEICGTEPGTELIGADEAMAWKAEKQQLDEGPATEAPEAEAPAAAADQPGEEGPHRDVMAMTEDMDDFRPDVAQLEIVSRGQGPASGRFLRVDAIRLSGLSNQVVELSTEKARGETLEVVFARMHRELRSIHRAWQQFQASLSQMNREER